VHHELGGVDLAALVSIDIVKYGARPVHSFWPLGTQTTAARTNRNVRDSCGLVASRDNRRVVGYKSDVCD
jgi:hypothetical protein